MVKSRPRIPKYQLRRHRRFFIFICRREMERDKYKGIRRILSSARNAYFRGPFSKLSFLHLADRPAHHFPLKGCSAYFLLTEHPLGARDELVRHTSSKPLTLKGMGGSIDSPRLSQFYARLKVDYLLLLYWTLKTELVRTTRFLLRRISSIPWYPHIDTCLQENTGLIGS